MSTNKREAFLTGDRPGDIAVYIADQLVDDPDALAEHGHVTDQGTVLVLDGETGRKVFKSATGMDALGFAKSAMNTEGEIADDLTGGVCPECGKNTIQLLLAFAEEQNEAVGGIYAESDVIHAYAQCDCGARYSDKWTL